MSVPHNPLGREYSKAEIAAGIRVGAAYQEKRFAPYPKVETVTSGPMIYATGPYHPEYARKMAEAWKLVADAMEREWAKEEES